MASDAAIIAALKSHVRQILASAERDNLTVNKVRALAENDLGLENGYLKGGDWKDRSKEVIKNESERLMQLEEAGEAPASSSPVAVQKPKPAPKAKPAPKEKKVPVKKGTKRKSPPAKAPPKKRRRKDETSEDELSESEESSLSVLSSESEEAEVTEEERPKKRAKATGERGKKVVEESDDKESSLSAAEHTPELASDIEDSDASEAPKPKKGKKITKSPVAKTKSPAKPKAAAKSKPKPQKVVESESEAEKAVNEEKSDNEDVAESTVQKDDDVGNASDSSELSVLIDEPPKRKSKSKTPTTKSSTKSKPTSSSSKSKSKPTTTALSPADTELKTLQSQLLKCGIRKIWAFELKQYGDDTGAKIKHLKKVLREAGMDGRFSEAKAREIKELRELQQDLEAVTEGAKLWGEEGGKGRARRSAALVARGKVKKELKGNGEESIRKDGDEEDEEESEEEEEEEFRPMATARAVRAKAGLDFLSDEEDSD